MRPIDPRLIPTARGVRVLLATSVALGLASTVATVVQAVLLARILSAVIIGGSLLPEVVPALTLLAVVVLIRAILAWASEELARRSAAGVIIELRRKLLLHAASLGPRWRSGVHGGELSVLAGQGLDSLNEYLARYLPQLVLATLVPLGMVVYLVSVDLSTGIIVVITLPLIPLFMALVGWYTQRQTKAKMASLRRLAGHFTDVVAGLPTLKVFGRAKAQAEAVRTVTDNYRRTTMGTLRVAFLSSLVLELLASLSVALVAVSVGLRLVSGHLTLQIGLTALILAPEAYLPLRALGTQFHAAADGVAAAGAVLDILATAGPVAGTRAEIGRIRTIEIEAVVVGATGQRGAVGPLNLTVRPGAITVVTGPSGSGKTTLLEVVAGVLRPSAGMVRIVTQDGHVDLSEIDPATWRRRIAWSGQRPVLRPGTIRDNLEAPDADDDERRQALVDVAADAFVDALPLGWDTPLGDRGRGLSQGQRQRICLARLLLRSRLSDVILMDEPTAALDTDTELRVLAGLSRALRGHTVILVSHRLAPLSIADHVVRLNTSPASKSPAVSSPPDQPGNLHSESMVSST